MASTAVETFGGLDVLVNNAGIMDGMTDAEWERVIRINLTAPFQLTRTALPHMLARGKAAIVNTASAAASPRGRAVLVVGPSGAGKSALLRAGLLAAIADRGALPVPGSRDWPQVVPNLDHDPALRLTTRSPVARRRRTRTRRV